MVKNINVIQITSLICQYSISNEPIALLFTGGCIMDYLEYIY